MATLIGKSMESIILGISPPLAIGAIASNPTVLYLKSDSVPLSHRLRVPPRPWPLLAEWP